MAKQLFTFTKERPDYRTIWEKLPDTYEHKIGMHNDFETKCILYSRLMLMDWNEEVVNLNKLLSGKPFNGSAPSTLTLIPSVPEGLANTYNPNDVPLDLLLFAKEQKPASGMFEKLIPDASAEMVTHHEDYDYRDSRMLTYYNLMYILPKKPTIDYLLMNGRITIDNKLETININSREDMIYTIINKLADICAETDGGAISVEDVNLTIGEFKIWNT